MFYVSYLANDADYQGVLLNRYRLEKLGSSVPYACICLEDVSDEVKESLRRSNIKVLPLNFRKIISDSGVGEAMVDYLASKFWFGKILIFLITGIDKCVFLDSDFLIQENLDHLFDLPVSGQKMYMVNDCNYITPNKVLFSQNTFNSGLIVYKPESKVFSDAVNLLREVESRENIFECLRSDQEFFNLLHHHGMISIEDLPYKYNVYPHVAGPLINSKLEDTIAVVHFIGRPKPWDYLNGLLEIRTYANEDCLRLYKLWFDAYSEFLKNFYFNTKENKKLVSDAAVYSVRVPDQNIELNTAGLGYSAKDLVRAKKINLPS